MHLILIFYIAFVSCGNASHYYPPAVRLQPRPVFLLWAFIHVQQSCLKIPTIAGWNETHLTSQRQIWILAYSAHRYSPYIRIEAQIYMTYPLVSVLFALSCPFSASYPTSTTNYTMHWRTSICPENHKNTVLYGNGMSGMLALRAKLSRFAV